MIEKKLDIIFEKHGDLRTMCEFTFDVLRKKDPELLNRLNIEHPIQILGDSNWNSMIELWEHAEKINS